MSSAPDKPAGFLNLGNSCFLNSILQCFMNIDFFKTVLGIPQHGIILASYPGLHAGGRPGTHCLRMRINLTLRGLK